MRSWGARVSKPWLESIARKGPSAIAIPLHFISPWSGVFILKVLRGLMQVKSWNKRNIYNYCYQLKNRDWVGAGFKYLPNALLCLRGWDLCETCGFSQRRKQQQPFVIVKRSKKQRGKTPWNRNAPSYVLELNPFNVKSMWETAILCN